MGEEATPKTEMINPALLDGVSANFIIKGPSGVEKSYPMRQLAVTIGRSDHCDISVKDSSMSGRHAEIRKLDGEIKVRDLGSANGIFLNGERIEEAELCEYPVEPSLLATELYHQELAPRSDGFVHLPDAPGLGVEPEASTIRRYLVDTQIKVGGRVLYETPKL